MADGDIIPFRPPVFPEVDGFSRTSGLGNPLGGPVGGTSVAVDLGDLAVEAGVDDTGNPVVRLTAPAVHSHEDYDEDFDSNLAERLPENILANIAEEVLEGVEADEMSRAELISQYEKGLDLLGNKIEEISASQGQKRGISRIGHPLLKEAMVKYHAGASPEMLPAAGPVKVSTIGIASGDEEERAQDFADTMNYLLTEVASEYYPDTAQMIMHQGYCGNAYKKVFRCPMRGRPVSDSIRMIDLIVSEEATSLDTALRVTHQFFPSRVDLRRMQILGKYRDIRLPPSTGMLSQGAAALKRSEGISPQALRVKDIPLHLYEQDLSLDPEDFVIDGIYERESPEGMPLPYKVTVDKNSRRVLGLWRNWEDGDQLYMKDNMYVRFGFVPGLGFHHWGFLQLLGDQTKALRAIWRLLIDSGMFSNFPAWIKASGARSSTNEINPGPGEAVDIDIPGGTDIRQVLMALPAKPLDAVFIQFAGMVQESAERLGGTVEIEVGEGRTNVPVGTIMSQIEQSTQIMAAVHKGNHRSQKEELMKFRKMFVKNPEDLWRLNPNPPRRWQTASEFMDLNLAPASDPNIPGQIHRIMQIWAVMMIMQQAPGQFDVNEVLRRALTAIRIGDPKTLLISPEQQAAAAANVPPPGPPPDPAKMAVSQAKTQQAAMGHQAKMQEMQLDAASKQRELGVKSQAAALESADKAADRQTQLQSEAMRMQIEREKMLSDQVKANQPGASLPQGGTAFDAIV